MTEERDKLPVTQRTQKIHLDIPYKKPADQKPKGQAAKKAQARKAAGKARAKNRGKK